MNQREAIIQLWFNMWLQQKDLGIDDIFTKDVVYIESWSPKYENRETVKHWFEEWNTRGKVLVLSLIHISPKSYRLSFPATPRVGEGTAI